MNRSSSVKIRKMTSYRWVVHRYKHKIEIEIMRTQIPGKRKARSTIAPDCKPEIWLGRHRNPALVLLNPLKHQRNSLCNGAYCAASSAGCFR